MADNIERLKDRLRNLIEPDFGLLDHLLSLQVLTDEELDEINSKKTIRKRNDKLLKYLADKTDDKRRQFLTALETTQQLHVVNYITRDAGQL
jgi:hypothetical protein